MMDFLGYVGAAALYIAGTFAVIIATIFIISKIEGDGMAALALMNIAIKAISIISAVIGLLWIGHIL